AKTAKDPPAQARRGSLALSSARDDRRRHGRRTPDALDHRAFAAAARAARSSFRQIVFEDDEDLPLVAVGIVNPRLVLPRVAARRLHLVASGEARLVPARLDGHDVVRRANL